MNRESAYVTMVKVWKDLIDDDNIADVFGDGLSIPNRSLRGRSVDSSSEMTTASVHTNEDDNGSKETHDISVFPRRHRSASSPLSPALAITTDPAKSSFGTQQETVSAHISQPPARKAASRPSTTPEIFVSSSALTTKPKPSKAKRSSSKSNVAAVPKLDSSNTSDRLLRFYTIAATTLTLVNVVWFLTRLLTHYNPIPVPITPSTIPHSQIPLNDLWRVEQLQRILESQIILTLRFVSEDLSDLSPLIPTASRWWHRSSDMHVASKESVDALSTRLTNLWSSLQDASNHKSLEPAWTDVLLDKDSTYDVDSDEDPKNDVEREVVAQYVMGTN
jgi:hypothetical protein